MLGLVLLAATAFAAPDVAGPFPERSGVDSSLIGTRYFQVVFGEGLVAGRAVLDVKRAPKRTGAAYDVSLELEAEVGGRRSLALSEDGLLGADFGLVSLMATVRLSDGEEQKLVIQEIERVKGEWRLTRMDENGRVNASLPVEGPAWGSILTWLVASSFLPAEGGEWSLVQPVWQDNGPEARLESITVSLASAVSEPLRGVVQPLRHLTLVDPMWDRRVPTRLLISPEGQVMGFGPDSDFDKFRALACSTPACDDPVVSPELATERSAILSVMEGYVRAMMAGADGSLEGLVDWKALQADWLPEGDARDDAWNEAADARWRAELGGLTPTPDMPMDQLSAMLEALAVEIDDDRARVTFGGLDEAFELRRTGDGWRIVAIP